MTDPVPGRTPAAGYIAQRPTPGDHVRLLLSPPRDEDVLVADEIVYYKAPKHVMSLFEPLVETIAVIVVVTTILARPDYDGISLGLLVIVLSAIVVWRWVRAREWGWSALTASVLVGYVMITSQIEPLVLVPGVGLWFLARLGLRTLRWYRYEVRYLTNRRIIEATGFLGLQVASMPVTRVTDLVLNHTASGELFGYGDLRIESAGQDQALANVRYLVEPRTFHRLAVRLATKPSEIDLKNFIDVRPVRGIGR
ncbi:MAG: hypothetical protein ACI81L_003594 [Verrucomicrobiales bacterium]|jgi:hypothetical protein